MIGLDSNVLLRAMMADDPVYSPLARDILARLDADRPGHVSLIVLVELAWTLRSRYHLSRRETVQALRRLTETRHIRCEQLEAVRRALVLADSTGADIADALLCELNLMAGCRHTVTFDRHAASRLPSMVFAA